MTIKALTQYQAVALSSSGLTGATAASRYAGATASGAPSTGTFVTGDFVVAQNGHIWICTAGGTPGTWVDTAAVSSAVTSVAGRTGVVTLTAADIGNGNFTGGAYAFTGGGLVTAYGTYPSFGSQGVLHTTTAVATATNLVQVPWPLQFNGQYWTGAASAAFTTSISSTVVDASGHTQMRLLADTVLASSALTATGLLTASGGITVPSGQSLTTGTRTVVTGTRAVTTNASDTVDLGTFSSTGGAIELRIHAHLAAPAAGTTASVTKVYEFAASATMGTVSTWYLLAPADASANAAAANDFAIEVQRTALNTFQFRFRQKSIGVAGSITFTVETLGDTAVTFTPSTTITAAPAAVSTFHPSNSMTLAAGNVGIGTEAPAYALDAQGTGTDVLGVQSSSANFSSIRIKSGGSISTIATVGTAAQLMTDTVASDLVIAAVGTVRLGVLGSASALRVSASDVVINDNGAARSAPRGTIGVWRQGATTGTTISASTAETAIFSGVGSFAFVSGRRYRISVRLTGTVTTASASARFISWVKLGAGTGGTGIAEAIFPIDSTAAGETFMYWGEGVAGTDFAAGTTSLSITASFSSSNTFTPLAASNPPIVSSEILVEDIGT